MGSNVSISGEGSFIIGDHSRIIDTLSKLQDNRFYARFASGYYLYTDSLAISGAYLAGDGSSWSSISDSTKKENFKPVNGETVLNNIRGFRLGSWNYIGQDPAQLRHYGPMAQEFYHAFGHDGIGVCGNDTTLASADVDGINMIAIQALEKRSTEDRQRIHELEETSTEILAENQQLKLELAEMKKVIAELCQRIGTDETQMTSANSQLY